MVSRIIVFISIITVLIILFFEEQLPEVIASNWEWILCGNLMLIIIDYRFLKKLDRTKLKYSSEIWYASALFALVLGVTVVYRFTNGPPMNEFISYSFWLTLGILIGVAWMSLMRKKG